MVRGRRQGQSLRTMNRQEIATRIHQMLVTEFEIEPELIREDAALYEELGLDSLDAIDLVVALEDAFGGRVPEEVIRQVRRVSDLYNLVEQRLLPSA